ncbi:hypothetical protein PG993_005977 [Apiospora rasikravindrae]|uniref:Uncharacterized protein n=1 Tax=Apiospora rasikravindrae TaxID=990691 RepID=A0ABR1TAB6_9PEZI
MAVNRDVTLLSDPTLLEKVDKLRDLNIGQHVPLPQSLCTRHATQITFRRGTRDHVDIRIIPGPHASEEHRKSVEQFHTQVASGSEFRGQFVDILKKVSRVRYHSSVSKAYKILGK